MSEEKKAFDFDGCFSSLAVEEEGIDVPILRDDNKKESGFVVRLAGPNSGRMRGALNKAIEARVKLAPGTVINNDHMAAENLDSLVSVTLGWRYPEGFDGPAFSPEEARKLYIERGGIRNQAWAAAQNVSLFMKR